MTDRSPATSTDDELSAAVVPTRQFSSANECTDHEHKQPRRKAMKDEHTVTVTAKYLDALRKAAGLHIDPETAIVNWEYRYTCDPYGDHPDLPTYQQIGREYFARSPESNVWVLFEDLPDATHDALWENHKRRLSFPASLLFFPDESVDERGHPQPFDCCP